MTDLPADDVDATPKEVIETEAVVTNSPPHVDSMNDSAIDATSITTPSNTAPIVDVVPLSSQPSVRPAKRSLWSTRVSLLLVAALVGGLAGHYASPTNSGPGGVTIDAVTNSPGAGSLPGGISIPKLINKALPSIVSIDVKGQGIEDQGTGMVITSS